MCCSPAYCTALNYTLELHRWPFDDQQHAFADVGKQNRGDMEVQFVACTRT